MEQADIDSEYFSRGVALGKIIVADDASAMRSWLKNHQEINDANGVSVDWESLIMIEDVSIDDTSEVVMGRAVARYLMENHAYKCLDEILRHPYAGEAILSPDQWYMVNKSTGKMDKAASNHGFFTLILALNESDLDRWFSASVIGWKDFFKEIAGRSKLLEGFVLWSEPLSVKYGLARIMNYQNQCNYADGSMLAAAYSAGIVTKEDIEWLGKSIPWLFRFRNEGKSYKSYEWVVERTREIDN